MALSTLSLSVTSGVQGRPFQAKINGLTTGKVEVLVDGAPGFSTVNGNVLSSALPYPVSTVVLREYEPGVGVGYRDTRIEVTAATEFELAQQARAVAGASYVSSRAVGTKQADGSTIWSLAVTSSDGGTTSIQLFAIAAYYLVDELGNRLVDELGNVIAGQDASKPTTIKAAAAARGFQFGIAYKPDAAADTPEYRALVLSEAGVLVPETCAQATVWCTARATYDFTRFDQFLGITTGASLPWKVPSGFIYPAHDMSWVSTVSGNAITPVNDGTGTPAVRADTWQAIIDELVARFRLYCDTKGTYPTQINASNELTDPDQTDGWRRHPWYTATSGPGWLSYLINKLKATFPGTPVGLCQDFCEQPDATNFGDGYGTRLQAKFLTNLDTLIAAGAKPDYVDLQGHMKDTRGWNPVAFRTLLQTIRAKGIKVIAGEVDYQITNPTSYTAAELDKRTAQAVSQYLSVLVPNIDGGLIAAWCLGDTYNAWTSDQRPLLYDTALTKKQAYYAAYVENINWSY
jgi:GH35 family endo-1,4-beta-xylanase